MSREILILVDSLAREKSLDVNIVYESLEAALASALRRQLDVEGADVVVEIDRTTGEFSGFRRWLVVPDEAGLQEPDRQEIYSDAQDIQPGIEVGEYIVEPIPSADVGRIGAQVARQAIMQRIRDAEREQITRIEALFKALAKVESLTFLAQGEEPPLSSSSVVGHASVFVPMKGLIDPKAELGRLQKDLDKVQKQHDQIATKLSNEGFVAKAPAAVVEGEKAKLAEFANQLAKIKANMEQIAAL